jgi:hypothetical protein
VVHHSTIGRLIHSSNLTLGLWIEPCSLLYSLQLQPSPPNLRADLELALIFGGIMLLQRVRKLFEADSLIGDRRVEFATKCLSVPTLFHHKHYSNTPQNLNMMHPLV